MSTFVVVHGAWGGAWSWNRFVVPMLRKAGHDVYAATLTGLGERTHLASPEVTVETHVQDVANVLFYEDLHDVVLAGHSYGGNVISGVADRMPERLAQLVYMDAGVPWMEGEGDEARRRERAAQAEREGTWRIMPGDMQADDPEEIKKGAAPRRSGQPVRTFTERVRLERGVPSVPKAFVYCAKGKEPGSAQAERAERIKADPAWRYYELDTGHNLHYSAPEETVRILLELAKEASGRGARREAGIQPVH
jgi:pimeloyl-ACP methyl ester carboxylesterase